MLKRTLFILPAIFLVNTSLFAQVNNNAQLNNYAELNGQTVNSVSSAVPFMTIAPESRGGAMGDAGVATSPDVNSMHWNPAKYAFAEGTGGVAVSYTPWLKNLVNDINLYYVTGYFRLKQDQVLAGSLRFFALGEIEFRDNNSDYLKTAKPNEYALDVAYSRVFGEHFSGAIAFRYIRSDLSKGVINNVEMKAGQSGAADVSAYYVRPVAISDKKAKMSFGLNISNIGNKMAYSNDQKKDFHLLCQMMGGASTPILFARVLAVNSQTAIFPTSVMPKLCKM